MIVQFLISAASFLFAIYSYNILFEGGSLLNRGSIPQIYLVCAFINGVFFITGMFLYQLVVFKYLGVPLKQFGNNKAEVRINSQLDFEEVLSKIKQKNIFRLESLSSDNDQIMLSRKNKWDAWVPWWASEKIVVTMDKETNQLNILSFTKPEFVPYPRDGVNIGRLGKILDVKPEYFKWMNK